jgi:hypothetical protein
MNEYFIILPKSYKKTIRVFEYFCKIYVKKFANSLKCVGFEVRPFWVKMVMVSEQSNGLCEFEL